MRYVKFACLAISLCFFTPLTASELEPLIAMCEGCHGPNGVSGHADMPSIGGQSEKYILASLHTYKEWGRPCVKSEYRYDDTTRPVTSMCKVTENVTDEDFQAIAAHFAALPFVPADQPFDADKAAKGEALHAANCENCHVAGGSGVEGRGPRLAGQWTPYLRDAFKFVPTGEHLVPRAMENMIIELSTGELEALLNYYASQQAPPAE